MASPLGICRLVAVHPHAPAFIPVPTIAHRLLSDPDAHFTDLGPYWHDRIAPLRRKRQLIAELERLSGKKVLLEDAAA